tara:strand:- start:225 stop:413 length:189 start_codon:yes stop_codon:yes gene_type:complete
MFSQFVLKRKIKQVFLLVVHMRLLFSLSPGNPAAAAAAAAAAAVHKYYWAQGWTDKAFKGCV